MNADPLAALKEAYRAALPAKVEAIAQAVSARDRGAAQLLAHRLCGTSGSYGFARVGEAAGRIEQALRDGADWAAIDSLLDDLGDDLRRDFAEPRANG